jgi:NhaP-type Na+/H+ or K+/H+ antiporter/Trk K+ transport system NAD-binding subunit
VEADTRALLTIALVTVIGVFAQVVGTRWRMPPIVLLLLFGVLAGPSVLGWVDPGAIGSGLTVLVKLAVAIILFDGALNLRLGDLRRTLREVRRLVTVGVVITAVGATLAAYFLAGMRWETALVFGTLVSVTGPTVVQPLLKRIELPRSVRATLEGEAIIVDPIGAILAVTVFDIVLEVEGPSFGVLAAVPSYVIRIGIGALVGVAAGLALSRLLRWKRAVPAELANLVALAGVWGAFALAETLRHESGIMAAVAMGLAMQRDVIPEEHRLRRFKEQLTVLGISMLFVLLAAALPAGLLRAEGWKGVLTVAVLMFVVRPISVFFSLIGSTLNARERTFIAWIGPRGIVAASVASLFALRLAELGMPDSSRLLALTFLTIAITVTVQGLSASLVARALKLHGGAGKPAIVLGAGPLALTLARVLADAGRPVSVVDRNATYVRRARQAGLDAVRGNGLDESVLEQAGASDAEVLVALTTNPEVNALAAQVARDRHGIPHAYPAIGKPEHGVTEELLSQSGARLAFGRPVDVRRWDATIDAGAVQLAWVTIPADWNNTTVSALATPDGVLAVARRRGDHVEVTHPAQRWQRGDRVALLTAFAPDEALRALVPPGTAARSA